MGRVHVVGTGGTIASRSNEPRRGAVASDSVADLLGRLHQEVEITSSEPLREGSFRLTLAQLRIIADEVARVSAEDGVAGVVVTHGTDTMEETAFLVDLVHAAQVPVIFTGAQRAADHPDSDGPRNLGEAIAAAAHPGLRGIGAAISFAGVLRAARHTRKAHTLAPDPFAGGAIIAEHAAQRWHLRARPVRPAPLPTPTDTFNHMRVELLTMFPGANPDLIPAVIDLGANAIVLAGTGAGNAPAGFVAAVAEAVGRGVPVVLSSRTGAGEVAPIYGNGGAVDLMAAGATPAGGLNPQQARILTAVLLSQGRTAGQGSKDFTQRFGDALAESTR